MTVTNGGRVVHVWRVSTARSGYSTPRGSFRPQRMSPMWYSRKYDNSPMPYSVFFRGGYAIHGTGAVKRLGTPASHGCVRLHTSNAATLYSMIKQVGARNARIVITQ
jgi:lipoprotein-anchoring transpeptidase ErfK/SrfK